MIKYLIKLFFAIILVSTNIIQSQTTTIDYSNFSSSACNIFGSSQTINTISHQTTYGQPKFNNSNKSVQLSYFGTTNKGDEYKLFYNFKQNYTYKITLVSRNATGGSNPAGLKVCIGDNGSGNNCDGVELIPRYAKSPDFEFYIPKKVPRLFGTFCFYKLTLRKVS